MLRGAVLASPHSTKTSRRRHRVDVPLFCSEPYYSEVRRISACGAGGLQTVGTSHSE
ncbi:hypothetical protein SSCG_04999 [Streptomyces clavuligerus]|nr:hypothetical protein SSCG_04999 [Streptomyces clavuligerus]